MCLSVSIKNILHEIKILFLNKYLDTDLILNLVVRIKFRSW